MTAADIIILAVLLASGALAMARGFTLELLSIIAFVLAAIVALFALPYVQPLFADNLPEGVAGTGIVLGGTFLVALIPLWVLGDRLSRNVRRSAVGAIDRTFGFAFGAVRGLFVLAIAYLVFTGFAGSTDKQPGWIKNAALLPLVAKTAEFILTLAPEDSSLADHYRSSAWDRPGPLRG